MYSDLGLLFLPIVICGFVRGEFTATPILMNQLPNITVPEGKDAAFTCSVENLGGHKVAWIKSDSKAILAIHDHVISNTHKISVTHNDKDTWTLTIKEVKRSDAGIYMCQVNSEPMVFKKGRLTVVVSPIILDSMSTSFLSIQEGQRAEMMCRAEGIPKPRITWHKSGEILGKSFRGNKFTITNVSRYDMGEYICIAQNGIPPAKSKSVTLQVNFKPQIFISENVFGAPRHTKITIACTIHAFPKAIAYWTDSEEALIVDSDNIRTKTQQINHFQMKLTLVIKSATKRDFKTYVCVGKNTIGKSTKKTSIFEMKTSSRITPPVSLSTALHSESYLYTLRQTDNYQRNHQTDILSSSGRVMKSSYFSLLLCIVCYNVIRSSY